MSAFVCNDFHISSIVSAGVQYKAWVDMGKGWDYLTEEKAQHAFEVLKRENIRSVNKRYKENTAAGTEQLGRHRIVLEVTALGTLKAIACLEYQSCEHPEWETSLAYRVLQAIKEAAIRALPGYQDASWEIQEPAGYVEPISIMALVRKRKAGL